MVGIHCTYLASIIAGFVGVLIIQVIWYANFGINQWVTAHILETLITEKAKLVSDAVSNGGLSYFDGKSRSPVFAP
jgi:hypothetical protein